MAAIKLLMIFIFYIQMGCTLNIGRNRAQGLWVKHKLSVNNTSQVSSMHKSLPYMLRKILSEQISYKRMQHNGRGMAKTKMLPEKSMPQSLKQFIYSQVYFLLVLSFTLLSIYAICKTWNFYWPCSHSRAIPGFPSQLEWKIGLAWANLPFELRRKAGDCSRVTAGPIDLI